MDDPQNLPIVTIGYEDVRAISHVLHPYTLHVQRHSAPSFEKATKLLALQTLSLRFKQAAYNQDTPLMLTVIELQVIDEAFGFFILFARQIIKESKKREEVLACCSKLKAYLKASFPLAHADAKSV